MLDEKFVTLYARSSRVNLAVAERDVILTYALKILSTSLLPKLVFKGGTCLKKVYFGNTGRFSMDLDFTCLDVTVEELKDGLGQLLNSSGLYGVDFRIVEENVRTGFGAVEESYLAVVHYAHSWNPGSEFTFEVSFRENPILLPRKLLLLDELYFKFIGFPRFHINCLQKEELLAEKLRAAFQRIRGRDLYDLYLFSGKLYNKDLVRKLVVVKCWNVRETFNPEVLLRNVAEARYDWDDLHRLVRKGSLPSKEEVTGKVFEEYSFLKDLNRDLLRIIRDSKAHKEERLLRKVM